MVFGATLFQIINVQMQKNTESKQKWLAENSCNGVQIHRDDSNEMIENVILFLFFFEGVGGEKKNDINRVYC